MGTSKILIDGVGIDLTSSTVTANNLLQGAKALDANGDTVTGTNRALTQILTLVADVTSSATLIGGNPTIAAHVNDASAVLTVSAITAPTALNSIVFSLMTNQPVSRCGTIAYVSTEPNTVTTSTSTVPLNNSTSTALHFYVDSNGSIGIKISGGRILRAGSYVVTFSW